MASMPFPVHALMPITTRPEIVFVEGRGSWMTDHNGKRYLDFVQGWAVNCLGHSPKVIADALAAQAAKIITPSPAFYNAPSLHLAAKIAALSGMHHTFFCNSGAEANEGAIKLARKWGAKHKNGAYEIITFHGAFHGRTLATMSASGKAAFEPLFEPKVPGFRKAPHGDLGAVERLIGANTVAVMLEPIQGEAGVYPVSDEFLRDLRKLATERGLLLILDEIQTGIGRTGKLFHYQHTGVMPDILTLGKGLGGGVPLAALVASETASCFEPGDQGGTFNGNPLMCAVGLAVLDTVAKPAFLAHVTAMGDALGAELARLADRYDLAGVRGRGLLQALDLGRPIGGEIVAAALSEGLLLNAPRPDALRFMPALDVTADEIATMAGILDGLLRKAGAGW